MKLSEVLMPILVGMLVWLCVYSCMTASGCDPAVPRSAVHVRPSPIRSLEPGGMTDAACLELMDKRDGAQLAGKILAGVGGVSALATAPDSVPEGARWGIGAGAATAAAVSVGVLWYGERKSDAFERYCEVDDESERDSSNEPVENSVETAVAPNPFLADGGVE